MSPDVHPYWRSGRSIYGRGGSLMPDWLAVAQTSCGWRWKAPSSTTGETMTAKNKSDSLVLVRVLLFCVTRVVLGGVISHITWFPVGGRGRCCGGFLLSVPHLVA